MASIKCKQCGYDNPSEAQFCGNCGSSLIVQAEQHLQPEVTTSTEQAKQLTTDEYMGFWVRFAAAVIDSLIITVASFMLYFNWIGLFIAVPLPWLYYWLFTGIKGQTLGKMALSIKVVDENGHIPGLGKAALREVVGKILSCITLYIGFLWIIWDGNKQGLHDKIANTYVVKAQKDK